MKITAIKASHTDGIQTAFKTDPPLTEEVMQCAINDIFGSRSQWEATYFEEAGLFIVRGRTDIPREQIQEYEQNLTSAENLVRQRKEHANKKREDHLKRLSESTGLPVE
jgi:hypothetical protein